MYFRIIRYTLYNWTKFAKITISLCLLLASGIYICIQYFSVLCILLFLLVILMTFVLYFAARVISDINDCWLAYDNMLEARMFVERMPFKLLVVRWLLLAISVQNVFSRPLQESNNTNRRTRSTPIYDDVVSE